MLLKVNKNPSAKELREFGIALIVGFGVMGSLMYWRHKPTQALWIWGVSCGIGVLAIVFPRASKIFYFAWMGIAVVMGGIMTRIILTILFVFVITPVALVFRLISRDALRLKEGPVEASHWVNLPKITDPNAYKRLF